MPRRQININEKIKKSNTFLKQKIFERKLMMGLSAMSGYKVIEVSKMNNVSQNVVRYWKKKIENWKKFHWGPYGGKRSTKFSNPEKKILNDTIIRIIKTNPDSIDLRKLSTKLKENGINVNRMYISRILRSWRWSWKIPVRFHLYKYTKDNIDRYMHWVHWIQDIPWIKLKFLDEAHFIGRSM
jgi:transposase